MLTQRPVGGASVLLVTDALSRQELDYMREMAAQRFDTIMVALRSMPRPLLLTIRWNAQQRFGFDHRPRFMGIRKVHQRRSLELLDEKRFHAEEDSVLCY